MLPQPELLATVLFSGFFIILGNSYGNSVTFAKQTILASDSNITRTTDLDSRLVRFIAIVVLSAVCILHYSSNRFGLFLNKLFALFKTILLLTVFIAGMKAIGKEGSGLADFYDNHGVRHPTDGLSAMVLILYSYQGWENANYVCLSKFSPAYTLIY
jgi:amino acid transporter